MALRGLRGGRARLRPRRAEHRRCPRRCHRARHGRMPRGPRARCANARARDLAIETAMVDWAEPDELVQRAPFDLVLASDVLYERPASPGCWRWCRGLRRKPRSPILGRLAAFLEERSPLPSSRRGVVSLSGRLETSCCAVPRARLHRAPPVSGGTSAGGIRPVADAVQGGRNRGPGDGPCHLTSRSRVTDDPSLTPHAAHNRKAWDDYAAEYQGNARRPARPVGQARPGASGRSPSRSCRSSATWRIATCSSSAAGRRSGRSRSPVWARASPASTTRPVSSNTRAA